MHANRRSAIRSYYQSQPQLKGFFSQESGLSCLVGLSIYVVRVRAICAIDRLISLAMGFVVRVRVRVMV